MNRLTIVVLLFTSGIPAFSQENKFKVGIYITTSVVTPRFELQPSDSIESFSFLKDRDFGFGLGSIINSNLSDEFFISSRLGVFFSEQQARLVYTNSSSTIDIENAFISLGTSINYRPFPNQFYLGIGTDLNLNIGTIKGVNDVSLKRMLGSGDGRIGFEFRIKKLTITPELGYSFVLTNMFESNAFDYYKLNSWNFTVKLAEPNSIKTPN